MNNRILVFYGSHRADRMGIRRRFQLVGGSCEGAAQRERSRRIERYASAACSIAWAMILAAAAGFSLPSRTRLRHVK